MFYGGVHRTLRLTSCRLVPSQRRLRNFALRLFSSQQPFVHQRHPEGLLVSSNGQSNDGEQAFKVRRGTSFENDGFRWVCAFEVDRYWFATPLSPIDCPPSSPSTPSVKLVDGKAMIPSELPDIAIRCLERATPTQAQRASLSRCLPTGVVAVDVLAPIGCGQSMLICGPEGTGKSTLAKQVLEQAASAGKHDKVIRFTELGGEDLGTLTFDEIGANKLSKQVSSLATLWATVGIAEEFRDAGKQALVVLDSVRPLLAAWELAVKLAEAATGSPLNVDALAAQRRSCFAGLFERAANVLSGGTLTLLVLLETDAMAALTRSSPKASNKQTELSSSERIFSLEEFANRKPSELERLKALQARGVKLTSALLKSIGIAPPVPDVEPKNVQGVAAREMQSLSDGQIILDKEAAAKGLFPAVVAGATFSRFGLGSSSTTTAEVQHKRDVRPAALQAVAAHLRTLLALELEAGFRPKTESLDSLQSAQMEAVKAALLQSPTAPARPEEMTALLLAACSGALNSLSQDEVARALRGGGQSPLLAHLREAAPSVLSKIAEDTKLSSTTIPELEVAVRLFVKLKQASAA